MRDSKLKGLRKINNLVLILQSGKVSTTIVKELIAKAYAENNNSLVTVRSNLEEAQSGNTIAIAKGQDGLIAQVNKTIDHIQRKDLINKQCLPAATRYMKTEKKGNTFAKYIPYFFKGTQYAIIVVAFPAIIGIVLGIILALIRLSKNPILHRLAICYIRFICGTPQMVQILFVYFGIGYLISNLSALVTGIIAIRLNSGAYVAEDVKSGVNSLPKEQMETARSLGLGRQKAFRYVVIPQAIKDIWPALGNEFTTLLKGSSLVPVIGVAELVYQAQLVQTSTYKGVLPLFIAMIIYSVMTFSLTRLLNHFEKGMKRGDNSG